MSLLTMKRISLFLSICFFLALGLLVYVQYKNFNYFAQVIFFDIGQGDAALIKFADGEKMLVDCGADKKILAKLGTYLSFYDQEIDYLLITHFDLDHYGGCIDVLKRYQVKNIITNGQKKETDRYWQEWDKVRRSEQAKEYIISQPQVWQIAKAKLEFLNPDPSFKSSAISSKFDSNNESIVFRLAFASSTVLFTGDMGEPIEKALLGKYCSLTLNIFKQCPKLAANILKIGHHGSDSSSNQNFIAAVQPLRAIISVGKNKYGHPSWRVLKKLERAKAIILRTDEEGDVDIKL